MTRNGWTSRLRGHELGPWTLSLVTLLCCVEFMMFIAAGSPSRSFGHGAVVLRGVELFVVSLSLLALRRERTQVGASLALVAALLAGAVWGDTVGAAQRALLVAEVLLCGSVGLAWTLVLAARPLEMRSRL